MDFLVDAAHATNRKHVNNIDRDASLILHMIVTKTLHIKQMLSGIQDTTSNGKRLSGIVDPTVLAAVCRSLFEQIGLFNLVFVQPGSEEEITFRHSLWVLSGLKNRQQFADSAISKENVAKAESDRQAIVKIEKDIIESAIYQSLSKGEQEKLTKLMQKKEYLVSIENGVVKKHNWFKLYETLGMKPELSKHIYRFYTQYSHPTHTSVYQFNELFDSGKSYMGLVMYNVTTMFQLLSIYIADYVKYFPHIKDTFESRTILEQITIDYPNRLFRGDEHGINDSITHLS